LNELLRTATFELVQFLGAKLPDLSPEWWQTHVVDCLSFQQQRIAETYGHKTLDDLDLAALLRVFYRNWSELAFVLCLPREGRNWLKELQTVRNKWAHLSAREMPASEVWRDADTLGRFLKMIGARQTLLDDVDSAKAAAAAAMVRAKTDLDLNLASSSDELGSQKEASLAHISTTPPTADSGFKVGDLVALRSNPAVVMPVIEVLPGSPECRYRVFHNNTKETFYESQLHAPVIAETERKTLSAPELRAYLTSLQILSPSTANLFSLRTGRVQFVPYQYRPVLKLIRSDRPRLLIADEVGVGKTIEAGLIIKELQARMDLSKVLVICPKTLVAERKWFIEMKRFDEHFTALDGSMLRHCLQETHLEGEWPDLYSKSIVPFSLFDSDLLLGRSGRGGRSDLGLLNLDPPPKFDLVIVDEAHHIRNSETYLHQGVRYFCENADAVLFLTATPVQLGSDDLYTLLNVLRPDLVMDHASFDQMAEPNQYINAAIQHCRGAMEGWQSEASKSLELAAQTEWGRLFLRENPSFQSIYDQLGDDPIPDANRVGLNRAIEELYTFSPLINRTRRRDIGEFTTRKPETLTIEFTTPQRELHDGLLDVIARILGFCHGQQNVKFMMTTIRRQAASCLYGLAPLLEGMLTGQMNRLEFMEASDADEAVDLSFVDEVRSDIALLLEKARNLDAKDPKVEAFAAVLMDKSKLPNNKALVFSTFRHTLAYLAQHTERTGLRYGLIHGDVPDEDRAELRRRFALPKENANALDVLLSSEVGCEGLDFQFCDFLINYDLPWNPMRIEQRIGRIDRYGQNSEAVAIINFVTPGTVDAEIYDRCLWRIGVFQHAVGGNEEILGKITRELHDIAESFDLTPVERSQRLQQLADNSVRQIQEEQALESKQAELFGLNIPDHDWRQDIEAAESYWLSSTAIQRCVSAYLSGRLGSDLSHVLGEQPLKTLRLSQDARTSLLGDYRLLPRSTEQVAREWEKWLKGGQPTLAVTFDQETAAENSKAVHLSVVHPLVRQAARFLQSDDAGFVSLAVQSADVPAGQYRFSLYRWKSMGVKLDETLVPVASDSIVENALLDLLKSASDVDSSLIPQAEFDELDAQHHSKWTATRADHIAENRQLVEHRIQSLNVSHRARGAAISDQIVRATNAKIQLMKQSELARAEADFKRHMLELEQAANSGDILANAVLFGTITVRKEAQQ
jgi:ATP-dependent helicase HepA